MPLMVKITRDDDGDKIENPQWCAVTFTDGRRSLCSGQVYGMGESSAEYKEKTTGKVTCKHCISLIEELKEYKY